MRKVIEALRLRFEQQLSHRAIARSLGVAQGSVHTYLTRFAASGLPWPLPPELDTAALEARLFSRAERPAAPRPVPNWGMVHAELARKGVTLQLLWQEYKAQSPDGYQYTQFCRHYHAWAATIDPVLRQVYVAGERTCVDYAGPTVPIVDVETGEKRDAQIFVGALGASHLLYTEATWTQTLPDWIGAHVRMVEYYGGVTALIIPDNASALVRQPCYYEPEVNPTYQDFATHYRTAIVPARVAMPRDKAKVETAVQIVEREILAPLRHERFTSLAELNHALAVALERVNSRPFQKRAGSRRQLFETLERAALKPLPATRYELAAWRRAKVSIDYHISVERHLYSVPYPLVGQTVDVRLTATTVEILHHGARVAAHPRSTQAGRATTDPTHRPKSHQRHLDWTPSRLITWGERIGPATGRVVTAILERYPHPEQGYRACLGLFSLARRYTPARLEAAATRALAAQAVSYRSIKSMLATGVDQLPLGDALECPVPVRLPATHQHVRGPDYYRDALASHEPGLARPTAPSPYPTLTPHREDSSHAD
jgi:transposase